MSVVHLILTSKQDFLLVYNKLYVSCPQPSTSGRGSSERKATGWQTLVLYTVNLKQLDFQVNMSNVMGNTVYVAFTFRVHRKWTDFNNIFLFS